MNTDNNTVFHRIDVNDENAARRADADALRFMPLARRLAHAYEGRGAEYDDLVQEGFLALRELVLRWYAERPAQSMNLYLWSRLRGRVRDAAERLRRTSWHDSLDEKLEDDGFDLPANDDDFAGFDLLECLSAPERELAGRLARGDSQKDLAAAWGISQQAVSKRVAALRRRLRSQWYS